MHFASKWFNNNDDYDSHTSGQPQHSNTIAMDTITSPHSSSNGSRSERSRIPRSGRSNQVEALRPPIRSSTRIPENNSQYFRTSPRCKFFGKSLESLHQKDQENEIPVFLVQCLAYLNRAKISDEILVEDDTSNGYRQLIDYINTDQSNLIYLFLTIPTANAVLRGFVEKLPNPLLSPEILREVRKIKANPTQEWRRILMNILSAEDRAFVKRLLDFYVGVAEVHTTKIDAITDRVAIMLFSEKHSNKEGAHDCIGHLIKIYRIIAPSLEMAEQKLSVTI